MGSTVSGTLQPEGVGHAFSIGFQGPGRRADSKIAVGAVVVFPAFTPEYGSLKARKARFHDLKGFGDPLCFVADLGELRNAPLGEHHGFIPVQFTEVVVGSDHCIRGRDPWVVAELLPIGAHTQPVHVIIAGVILFKLVPLVHWIRVVGGMEDPDDVLRADRADTVYDMTISPLIKIGSGINAFGDLLAAAVKTAGPRKPVAIHLESPSDKDRAFETLCLSGPGIDISVPFSGNDGVEGKPIWSSLHHIRLVPRRPVDEGHGVVAGDDFQVVKGKALLSPIA